MVKTPRTRHSRTEREPQTIDLGPDEVSRLETEAKTEKSADEAVSSDTLLSPQPAWKTASSGSGPSSTTSTDGEPKTPESTKPEPPKPEPAKPEPAKARDDAMPRKDAPSAAPPTAAPAKAPVFGAGILGGIVALAVAGGLQYAGVLGTPGSSSASVAPSVPDAVTADIASLKSEIEALKSATPPDIGAVTGKVEGLSQALDQVRTEIASLKQAVEAGGAGENAGLDALNAKISEIENRIAGFDTASDGASMQEVAALGERIASVEALARQANEAGTDIASRLGALEQSVSALSTKVEAQSSQPKIALAIASSALKSAIERGAPFQSEIETFAAIAPDAPGLVELRSYAANGVATRSDLISDVDVAAKAMIAAANPPPANAGFFDRLLSSAESLVSVRPIGAVEGPGVPETVARMEVALQAGDLARAMTEYETLPDAAKAAGTQFAERVKARLAAEQLADQAIAAAMQAA